MAPPRFPNGMSLHDIGIAALKYPARPPPPYDVTMGTIMGALQRVPTKAMAHIMAQIASQYLNALLDYQTSDEPTLHDRSLPQYYLSTAFVLLNFLTTNPHVSYRIAARPAIINTAIDKMLEPTFIDDMKRAERPGGPHFPADTFEADFGFLLQTVSTIFLYTENINETYPRARELIPKLKAWKRQYKNSSVRTISNASDRLVDQIEASPELGREVGDMVRGKMNEYLVCGVASCGVSGPDNLTKCSGCLIQRYCGRDHQRADWKYHKHICNKGLVEEAPTSAAAE